MPTTYAIPQGNQYFDATIYTGNDSGQSIVNAGQFQPSLIWYKARSSAYYNTLEDDIRGAGMRIFSNLTDGESNDGIMTSFNTNGFTLGANSGEGINKNGVTYVAWQWKGATANTTNTSGTITSTVRVSANSGFSVITYSGNGTAGATVGHGLSSAPKMIFIKDRGGSGYNWAAYHSGLSGGNYALQLNTTGAQTNSYNYWNATAPDSSVFTLGNDNGVNQSGHNYISYCWSEVSGFSKFGGYTGNGTSDGPFVYLGFRPRFIMIKRTDASGNDWRILDTARDPYNYTQHFLYPDLSQAEDSGYPYDIVSNGFKIRTFNNGDNISGGTFVYAAFAENPFKYSNAR